MKVQWFSERKLTARIATRDGRDGKVLERVDCLRHKYFKDRRKTYTPRHRLYGLPSDSLSNVINSFFHMRWLQLLFKIVLPDTRAGVIFRQDEHSCRN
jgi:hypothetical protein